MIQSAALPSKFSQASQAPVLGTNKRLGDSFAYCSPPFRSWRKLWPCISPSSSKRAKRPEQERQRGSLKVPDMETPEKVYADGGLKSHRVMGLEDELTPTPGSTPNSKFRGSATPSPEQRKPEPASETQAGGVTGFIKSLVAGTPVDEPAKDSESVTHHGDLKDGTSGIVKTTSGTGSAPSSLTEPSSQPVGVAKTEIKEASSPYAPALESIAGPPESGDLSSKYGPALEPIADTSSYSAAGVVGAVSAAAGSAVETLKQATGYGTSEEEAKPTGATSGDALAPGPALVTAADLPKSAEVHPTEDGTVEIRDTGRSGTSGLAAGDASAPAAAVESHSAHEPTPQPPTASNVKHLQEAPATGQGATKTPQGVPSPAQEAPKPVKSAATQPSQGEVTGTGGKPPVSAFASNQSGTGGQKPAEIREDAATPAPKAGSKPAAAATTATKGAAEKKGKEGDKAKAPFCGCCTIS